MKKCLVLFDSFIAGKYVLQDQFVLLEESAAAAYANAGIVEVVDDADVTVIENGLKVTAIIPGSDETEAETEVVEDDETEAEDEVTEIVDLGDDEPQAPRRRRRS